MLTNKYRSYVSINVSCRLEVGRPQAFTCPENQVAPTSPENGLATFHLKFGDQDHVLMQPLGRHPYIIKAADQICNVTLDAKGRYVTNLMQVIF